MLKQCPTVAFLFGCLVVELTCSSLQQQQQLQPHSHIVLLPQPQPLKVKERNTASPSSLSLHVLSSSSSSQQSNNNGGEDVCYNFTVGDRSKGEFYSPRYPNEYPNNTECIAVLTGESLFDPFFSFSLNVVFLTCPCSLHFIFNVVLHLPCLLSFIMPNPKDSLTMNNVVSHDERTELQHLHACKIMCVSVCVHRSDNSLLPLSTIRLSRLSRLCICLSCLWERVFLSSRPLKWTETTLSSPLFSLPLSPSHVGRE